MSLEFSRLLAWYNAYAGIANSQNTYITVKAIALPDLQDKSGVVTDSDWLRYICLVWQCDNLQRSISSSLISSLLSGIYKLSSSRVGSYSIS